VPILENDDMDDRALLWLAIGSDVDSQPIYDEPIEIFVDWRMRRSSTVSADGTPTTLDATATVDRYIPTESRLWLAPTQGYNAPCALDQWYGSDLGSGSLGKKDEIMRVKSQRETWDAKKIERRYVIGMAWDRDQPD
jgi:hypothetical protein